MAEAYKIFPRIVPVPIDLLENLKKGFPTINGDELRELAGWFVILTGAVINTKLDILLDGDMLFQYDNGIFYHLEGVSFDSDTAVRVMRTCSVYYAAEPRAYTDILEYLNAIKDRINL